MQGGVCTWVFWISLHLMSIYLGNKFWWFKMSEMLHFKVTTRKKTEHETHTYFRVLTNSSYSISWKFYRNYSLKLWSKPFLCPSTAYSGDGSSKPQNVLGKEFCRSPTSHISFLFTLPFKNIFKVSFVSPFYVSAEFTKCKGWEVEWGVSGEFGFLCHNQVTVQRYHNSNLFKVLF